MRSRRLVAPSERARAFRKLVTLLQPGGRIVLSPRHGAADLGRTLHDTRADEIERLAADHGMQVLLVREQPDALGRLAVHWTLMVLALPDDSTGALPLVRGIILNDRKTSTYKLALLRIIARIADGSAGIAEPDEEYMRIPLGLVALYWIRAFRPLIAHNIPQSGTDRRGAGLGFVKEPFQALEVVSPLDLKLGTRLVGAEGQALRLALADAARTIKKMPASYLKFADGTPILPTDFGTVPPSMPEFEISRENLWQYGVLRVPRHLWQALRRLSSGSSRCWWQSGRGCRSATPSSRAGPYRPIQWRRRCGGLILSGRQNMHGAVHWPYWMREDRSTASGRSAGSTSGHLTSITVCLGARGPATIFGT
jgi:hypothetical protein